MDQALEADAVGIVLKSLDKDGYLNAYKSALVLQDEPGLAERCQSSARSRFDLETVGGVSYRRLYSVVLDRVGQVEVEVAA